MDELTSGTGSFRCTAFSEVVGSCECECHHGVLICNLPSGHLGLHYDSEDNITWKDGR